jgi:alpha-glucosidase
MVHGDDTCLVAPDRAPILLSEPADDDWWRGLVIYQVYVRSFQDTNDDGIGDLAGVLKRLDYIAALGVDAIWLSPLYRSPEKDFGYDVSDFRAIQPEVGSFEDFERLKTETHARGLKLILDFVPAHTSDEHAWFKESRSSRDNPKADWYVWADAAPDGTPPNNWISSFGGAAWTWDPRRAQFYLHLFLSSQPALNLSKPEVLEAMLEELAFWLRQDIDGVRLDSIQCITTDPDLRPNPRASTKGPNIRMSGGPANPFAKQLHLFDRDVPAAIEIFKALRRTADSYDPPKFLLGELSDVDAALVCEKYTGRRDGLHMTYGFDLINAPPRVADWRRVLIHERDTLRHGWNLNAFSNHDATRVVSNIGQWAVELGHQDDIAKLLLLLILTLRGGANLYQGDELGLTQAEIPPEEIVDPWGLHLWPDYKGRDGCRTPIPWQADAPHAGFTQGAKPWLSVPPEHRARAVDRQEADERSVLNFARRFIAWRKSQRPLILGDVRYIDFDDPLLVFERFDETRNFLVTLNFSADTRQVPLRRNLRALDAPSLDGHENDQGILLPPFAAFIAEQLDAQPE